MEYVFPPTKVIFGEGSLENLKDVVEKYEGKVMLFTGRKSMRKLGFLDKVTEMLKDRDIVLFDRVSSGPTTNIIEEAVKIAKDEDISVIIGMGGGSVIDTAKCTASMVKNLEEGKEIREYFDDEKKVIRESVPFIAIPTTSGTGAEVTRWAVVWDGKKKHTISGLKMYAKVAIVDPKLTYSLPRRQTASSGMDALSQGIESYWSRNHNPISDIFAIRTIELVFRHLEGACNNPENTEHRRGMSLAALFSGLAINGTKTTVCHSLSYPMTAYFGIPHGHACGLTIPSFMLYNSKMEAARIKRIVEAIGEKTIEDGAEKVRELMEKIGLETKLRKLGIDERGINIIVKNGFTRDRIEHNPRSITPHDIKQILMRLL